MIAPDRLYDLALVIAFAAVALAQLGREDLADELLRHQARIALVPTDQKACGQQKCCPHGDEKDQGA